MTRSTPPADYDDDFYAWTQEQAAALRLLPADGTHVDIAHVAEEIEDLGRRDLRDVESFLGLLVEHLIKVDHDPSSRDIPHWLGEALTFQMSALAAYSRSMRQSLDLAAIWRKRRSIAARRVQADGTFFAAPADCPFTLDELLVDDFDIDAALAKLKAARISQDGAPT